MLGYAVQALDVALYILGRAVVVMTDGEQSIDGGMVDLAQADVDSEDELYEEEYKEMKLGFQVGTHSPSVAARLRRGLGA